MDKRLIDGKQLGQYLNLSAATARKVGDRIPHAVKRIGKRRLYDLTVINAFLDENDTISFDDAEPEEPLNELGKAILASI